MLALLFVIAASAHATLSGAPVITSQPADYVAYIGADTTATFTIGVTASSPTYQWQLSGNGGASWSNLVDGGAYSGTATPTLTVAVASSSNGTLFRCVVTDASGSVTSRAALLTITYAPTQSALDSPSGTIKGYTSGAGWAFRCGGTITSYAMLVDGAPPPTPANFSLGVSRPDVQAYYAAHGCPSVGAQVGFTFTFDAGLLAPGTHQIQFVVTDDRGGVTRTNAQAVTVIPAPGSLVWTPAGTLPANTFVEDAAAVGATIYAIGGASHSCPSLTTLRAYDPGSASWGAAVLLPTGLSYARLAVVGNVVYVVGFTCGNAGSLQAYDVTSGMWSTRAPLPGTELQGVGAIDGRLYAVERNAAYVYDPAANAWTAIASPPIVAGGFSLQAGAVRAMNGLLYLAGGSVFGRFYEFGSTRLAVYDPQLNTWTAKAPMHTERFAAGLSALGGKLYALGGRRTGLFNPTTASVEAYDPALDQWTAAPDMPISRASFGAATVNGFLYAIGGFFLQTGQSGNNSSGDVTRIDALSLAIDPRMNIDEPTASATVGSTFTVRGWAIDLNAVTGTGVNDVHFWAYPMSGDSFGTPRFLGNHYFASRPDVGAAYGSQFTNSGFSLPVSGLPEGPYRIVAYVWSARAERFIQSQSVDITVALPVSRPVMSLDVPVDGAVVTQPFMAGGWAADLGAPSGNGVDAVHVWAFPVGGGSPIFVAVSYGGGNRPDVGAAFGSQFTMSGFTIAISSLAPGTYDLAVYAHSTVANAFNQARVVRITVQ
jgi:hypothetical protein